MVSHRADKRFAVIPAVMVVILLFCGWAVSAALLPSKQLPTEETLKGSLGNEKFNTLRFETYGGQPENRLIGYFLYRDGIRVKGDSPHVESIGKLTLNEVFADQARVAKAKFYHPGRLMIREISRGADVVGYAVNDTRMEVALWDVTTDASAISLELRYKDLQAKGERYYGGPR